MNRFFLSWVALAVLSAPALAAQRHATAAQCTALAQQFDSAVKDKVAPDKLKKAQSQRAEGADLCARGSLESGVKSLKSALKDIGIKPAD